MSEFYRPEVQTLPREQIRALQEELLQRLVRRIFDGPIPFFRDRLVSAGLGPDDIKSLDDLVRVPRTTKDDLRASEAAHPPLGDYRGAPVSASIRVSTSTGTTGKPTIALFTAQDMAVEYEAGARMFQRQGYRPGQVIAHAHPGGLNGGQALLGGVIENFGCLNVAVGPPMSPADAKRAVELWGELRPDHYEIFGPALHTFNEAAREMGLDPAADLGLPAPADMPPYRTVSAGLECFAFLGSACHVGNGAHVCEDLAIVEAVDPATGSPVPDGARGSLVVTTLTKDNAMLRYDLEDLVRLDRAPCPCGETHLRAFWEGRLKDVVRAGSVDVVPNDVWLVLSKDEQVVAAGLEFQIVRTADTNVLRVRVEVDGDARARLEEALSAALGCAVHVEQVAPGGLPRPYYKPLRVVDE